MYENIEKGIKMVMKIEGLNNDIRDYSLESRIIDPRLIEYALMVLINDLIWILEEKMRKGLFIKGNQEKTISKM